MVASRGMERVEQPCPWMWSLSLRTPTLPPATATNTLIVAGDRVVVIEPATPHDAERSALVDQVERLLADGRELAGLLITHHHADHVGAVEVLRERWGVPVFAHAQTAGRVSFDVDETLADGDEIELGRDIVLRAVFTPGHAPGHLVWTERKSGIAYAGDMVAGEGTILVDPEDDGDMIEYLASLGRMKAEGFSALVPSHGPVLTEPAAVLEHYIEHRLQREAKVLAAIEAGGSPFDEVLARAYDDAPSVVMPLAARALRAHLHKLEAEGRAILHDDGQVERRP